jgi:hypothetical protein
MTAPPCAPTLAVSRVPARTSLAFEAVMLAAAALIPPVLVFGILLMLALGIWPSGLLANLITIGVFVLTALWLVRFLTSHARRMRL